MKNRTVEILAPAGSYESMVAAVNAGADAVYIGGSRFGARAYANNLDEETMVKAINFMHLHGCRIYMTVNTLVKEKEMSDLYSYLKPYYEAGLDSVLVQDMGALTYIRKHFPDLPVHISTQMTVTGKYSARDLKALGAVRVVPARELSLKEIREIYDDTGKNSPGGGCGDRKLCPWSAVLLLFRPVPVFQPDRRTERKPGPVRTDLPSAF